MYTDKEIGNTLRFLRTNKQLSLASVCHEDLSRSFLSKVERGLSKISLNKFLIVLNRLNIDMDEFLFILRGNKNSESLTYSDELQLDFKNKNIASLQNKLIIAESIDNNFEKVMMTSIFLSIIEKKELPSNYYDQLLDYLFSVDEWGIYEIKLFGNAINCLSVDHLIIHGREILKKADHFMSNEKLYIAFISMLLNIIERCLFCNEIGLAEYFSHELKKIPIPESLVTQNLTFKFYINYIEFKKESSQLSHCLEILQLINNVGLFGVYNDLKFFLPEHLIK